MFLDKVKKNQAAEVITVLPYANILEQGNNIVLELDMPGADKDTLDVNLQGNTLVVRGRNKREELPKEYQPLYIERRQVTYERHFELNTEIDRDGVKADFADGVLRISLPKARSAQPRKIEIRS